MPRLHQILFCHAHRFSPDHVCICISLVFTLCNASGCVCTLVFIRQSDFHYVMSLPFQSHGPFCACFVYIIQMFSGYWASTTLCVSISIVRHHAQCWAVAPQTLFAFSVSTLRPRALHECPVTILLYLKGNHASLHSGSVSVVGHVALPSSFGGINQIKLIGIIKSSPIIVYQSISRSIAAFRLRLIEVGIK